MHLVGELRDAQHVRSELAEPFETLLSDEITTAARERAEILDREWRRVAEDWSPTAEDHLVEAGVQPRLGVVHEVMVGLIGQLSRLETPAQSLVVSGIRATGGRRVRRAPDADVNADPVRGLNQLMSERISHQDREDPRTLFRTEETRMRRMPNGR